MNCFLPTICVGQPEEEKKKDYKLNFDALSVTSEGNLSRNINHNNDAINKKISFIHFFFACWYFEVIFCFRICLLNLLPFSFNFQFSY